MFFNWWMQKLILLINKEKEIQRLNHTKKKEKRRKIKNKNIK